MSKYKILLKKELRELSRERIVLFGLLLGPLIMYLILGGAASFAAKESIRQAMQASNVAVLSNSTQEHGNITKIIASALGSPIYKYKTPSELFEQGYDAVIIIPEGFDSNITKGLIGKMELVYKPKSLGFVELSKPEQIVQVVNNVVRNVIATYLKPYLEDITADYLTQPVNIKVNFYYKGEIVSREQVTGLVFGVSLAIPLAVLMTAVAATQVAAISFGLEKEAKTLEKLFTLPITKRELLFGKLAAVALLAIGGVISYMVGFYIYMKMTLEGLTASSGGGETITFTIPTTALAVLAIGLALTLYTNIVLGFIIGSQASDVRSSQMAASYVSFLLAIPLFPMFFGVDITGFSIPVKLLLSLDPYALLGMVSSAGITGNTAILVLGTLGLILHGVFWTLIATRLLSAETMITGHPLIKRITVKFTKKTSGFQTA